MKEVYLPVLSESTSAVGFGCASLGSRVDKSEGIMALNTAYEKGVRWFDVAPSYGDGEAELNVGEFLKGKRQYIHICTKVGILPAQTPWLLKKIKPIARAVVSRVPSIRNIVSKSRPAAIKIPLTGEMVMRSVDASLRRLGTDYIDVLALHDASIEEIQSDEVLTALEQVILGGKVRAVSVASSLDVGIAAILSSNKFGFVQVANNPYEKNIKTLKKVMADANRADLTVVSHSAYGRDGALNKLIILLRSNHEAREAAARLGLLGEERDVAAAMLIAYAYSTNSSGVCLLSMFKRKHLDFNISKLDVLLSQDELSLFFDRFSMS